MLNNLFLTPFLISFLLASIFLIGLIDVFKNKDFSDKNSRTAARHIHRPGILRFGGVAIILAFASTLLLDSNLVISNQLFWVLLLGGGILLFGTLDDLWQLSWQKQLVFQVVIALVIFWSGIRLEYVTNPFGGIFLFANKLGFILSFGLVIGWILLIINAMNWVDGIDGVSGGITAIGALAIFFVSLRPEVNQPPVGIIAMALLGSMLAFLVFNFNPAKILAGTSGSVFMGFILAILALFAGAKIATTLLVLAIPVIDALWVIFERLESRSSVFSPDQRHLHYRLLELGWSQRKICFFYWLVTGLIAIISLNVGAKGKLLIFLVIVAAMIFGYFLIRKKQNV